MFKNRLYKSGSVWAFWRWTFTQAEHITRFHLIKTPWFAICLHWIHKPDPEPDLHDHPVTFLSIILKGWYSEWRQRSWVGGGYLRRVWRKRYNWIEARSDDKHSIACVSPGGCLTLCFMGPKVREWGFHTNEGWMYWKDYNKKYG